MGVLTRAVNVQPPAGPPPGGITFREGVTLSFAPGSGSTPADETLDPGTDPATGDIMVLVFGTSNAGGFPNPISVNNTFGGTWDNAHFENWGSRRTLRVDINDDWTTASGTVDADYGATAAGRVLIIVSGASNHMLPAITGVDNAGGALDWNPDLDSGGGGQSGHDFYLAVIQHENDQAVTTSSTGWTELGTQIGETSGVRRIAVFVGDASVPGFDTTPLFDWSTGGGFNGMVFGFTEAP